MTATAPPQLPDAFGRLAPEIEAELRRSLEGRELPLYDMLRYHLGWQDAEGAPEAGQKGKGLRPTLCLVAGEAVGGAHDRALPAAAAVELVHNFSLVHDDIQDGDAERHHRPTVWRVFGRAQAINAGTAMYALSGLALARLGERGVPERLQLAASKHTHDTCLRLLEGQYLDLAFERRLDITVDDYLRMVRGKTAALLGCATSLGAMLAGHDAPGPQPAAAFQEFGEELGLAFQIRDDMLGIWGDAGLTGKPVGADIRARKKSLPVVDALERTEGARAEALRAVYASPEVGASGCDVVLDILAEVGAEARARSMAERHRDRALAAVADLPLDPDARRDLEAIAAFLTERDH
ncbi:MAG TPA: polyprenyl synthetase family protein [Trueperaceae bacterium]|nr:polyprenyl synthetase family protein [Trueperaceae bacterium]